MKKITKTLLLGLVFGSMALTSCGDSGPKFTVTFDLNGGEGEIAPVQVKENGTLKEPKKPTKTDPVKGAIAFAGWYNGDTIWSFKLSKVKKDITLTARWLEKYTVTFSGVSDPAIATQYIDRGSQITKPANPTAPEGKVFYGWKNTSNGGQIWDFEDERLGKVMDDFAFEPVFVDANINPQYLEAELCPNILDMEGSTYSGGSQGRGLIGRDANHALASHGDYIHNSAREAEYATDPTAPGVFGGFVHHMYNRGNHLDWNFNSSEAASNVTMFIRLSAEYSIATDHPDGENILPFSDTTVLVKVNGTALKYGEITMHNVGKTGTNDFLKFQDFFLSLDVSLLPGANTIEFIADNSDFNAGTLVAICPVVDCLKLYTSSTITWPDAEISCLDLE